MKIVGLQPWHWPQIPDAARPRRCEDTKGVIAVDEKTNDLLAACIFDSWTFNSCQIHIFIGDPHVLRHGFQQEVFKFAFETAGRGVIIGATPADNEKALKFIKHMGLQEQFRIPDGFKQGVDLVLTTMRREDCRWLDTPVRLNVVT